jgi:hypothetical protein
MIKSSIKINDDNSLNPDGVYTYFISNIAHKDFMQTAGSNLKKIIVGNLYLVAYGGWLKTSSEQDRTSAHANRFL